MPLAMYISSKLGSNFPIGNGDTAEMESGVGSWGSRTAIAGASALMKVAGQIKEQVIKKYGKYSPEKLLSGNYSAYYIDKIPGM